MHAFIALYTGETIHCARLVWATADPEVVKLAADRMSLEADRRLREQSPTDPIDEGRLHVLHTLGGEAEPEAHP